MLHVENDLPFKSHFFLKRNFVTESLSPLVLLPLEALEMAFRLTCVPRILLPELKKVGQNYFLENGWK